MMVELVAGEIVEAAGECATVGQFARRMLEQLRRIAPFASALLLPSTPGDVVVGLDRKPDLVSHYRANQALYTRELARANAIGLERGAYIDVDVYSLVERQRLAFFNEIIRPQNVTSRIVAQLKFRGQPSATIHLCAEGRSQTWVRSLDRVRQLAPLLSLAYAASRSTADRVCGEALGGLTAHERRIARYVASGCGNKEIAVLMHLSPYTIRNELVSIYRKTGVANRAQLAALVARRAAPLRAR